jgi:hypothetical protein
VQTRILRALRVLRAFVVNLWAGRLGAFSVASVPLFSNKKSAMLAQKQEAGSR